MIKVLVIKKNDKLNTISIKGHAMYDVVGKDIVCASVSTLVISTINNVLSIDNKVIDVKQEENNILINIIKIDKICNLLLTNMIKYLEEIAQKYPKNIKITIKEE